MAPRQPDLTLSRNRLGMRLPLLPVVRWTAVATCLVLVAWALGLDLVGATGGRFHGLP